MIEFYIELSSFGEFSVFEFYIEFANFRRVFCAQKREKKLNECIKLNGVRLGF